MHPARNMVGHHYYHMTYSLRRHPHASREEHGPPSLLSQDWRYSRSATPSVRPVNAVPIHIYIRIHTLWRRVGIYLLTASNVAPLFRERATTIDTTPCLPLRLSILSWRVSSSCCTTTVINSSSRRRRRRRLQSPRKRSARKIEVELVGGRHYTALGPSSSRTRSITIPLVSLRSSRP